MTAAPSQATQLDPALDFTPEIPCDVRTHQHRPGRMRPSRCDAVAEHTARVKCQHCGYVKTHLMCTPHRVKLLDRPMRYACHGCGRVGYPIVLSVRPL